MPSLLDLVLTAACCAISASVVWWERRGKYWWRARRHAIHPSTEEAVESIPDWRNREKWLAHLERKSEELRTLMIQDERQERELEQILLRGEPLPRTTFRCPICDAEGHLARVGDWTTYAPPAGHVITSEDTLLCPETPIWAVSLIALGFSWAINENRWVDPYGVLYDEVGAIAHLDLPDVKMRLRKLELSNAEVPVRPVSIRRWVN